MKIEKVHSLVCSEQEWNMFQLKKLRDAFIFGGFFFSIIWNFYFENLFSVKILGTMLFLS